MVNCIKGVEKIKIDINLCFIIIHASYDYIYQFQCSVFSRMLLIEIHSDGQTEMCFPLNKMKIDHILFVTVLLKRLAENR